MRRASPPMARSFDPLGLRWTLGEVYGRYHIPLMVVEDGLGAYEQVWPCLVVHDPAYPTADTLRAVTCIGNVKTTGCVDEDTDGHLGCNTPLVAHTRVIITVDLSGKSR